jgi:hypothetical protein
MPPAPPSPPPAEELRLLYLDKHLSRRDLAAHYGVTLPTVKAWLHNAGIRRPPSWATTVSAQQLRQLYLDQGLTAAQIANRQHVSTSQVYQALRRHHLRRDTPGHAPSPHPPPPSCASGTSTSATAPTSSPAATTCRPGRCGAGCAPPAFAGNDHGGTRGPPPSRPTCCASCTWTRG